MWSHDKEQGLRNFLASGIRCAVLPPESYHPYDLKPQNVLFDAHMNIKIMDFGLGTLFTSNKLST